MKHIKIFLIEKIQLFSFSLAYLTTKLALDSQEDRKCVFGG